VSTDPALSATQPPGRETAAYGIVPREDGVYLDLSVPGAALAEVVDNIFGANNYFAGLDYALLLRALYLRGDAPAVPQASVRLASGIVPFDPARRALYRSVKISGGEAEYYFEPVFLPDAADPDAGMPARLDADEFVADMWLKGIRFGIDLDAVRAAIAAGHVGRVVVARRLDPVPGQDARVIEVSDEIHRNDAPRQLANGRLDLNTFQNRFPQIQQGVRLLKKLPRVAGTPGYELGGRIIEPAVPQDVDLQPYCGLGTAVERTGDGEFLVAQQAGFLSVDAKSSKISVGAKIVSRDGVSVKTTGNLCLTGDYEEFGEVQEKRVIEGEGITVHGDVFGKLVSRGGAIVLNSNLIGGTAFNHAGDIVVRGMASAATIQTKGGAVSLQRAENCVVSGTRIRIEHAVNCEIIGDEVAVGQAEGCAIAGRNVAVDTAAPRRQGEMLVYVHVADGSRIEQARATIGERVAQLVELAGRHKGEMARLASQPDVSRYMRLATSVRKNEITLAPEQVPAYQRLAQAVAPSLKEIGRLSAAAKAAETDREQGLELLVQIERQREGIHASRVLLRSVQGETQVRMVKYEPDGSSMWDLAPREIKARLRGNNDAKVLFARASGSFDWASDGPDAP
jgi:hypothetical protein